MGLDVGLLLTFSTHTSYTRAMHTPNNALFYFKTRELVLQYTFLFTQKYNLVNCAKHLQTSNIYFSFAFLETPF